jgi:F-type H+-transporting ATPase subunit b
LKNPTMRARFFTSIFSLSLLAALFAAYAAVPVRLAAQQPAPAAAAANPPAAQPEPSEEEQTNAFRLEGPMVKATAKAFHLSLETAARGFEIFNFLIIVLGIGIPLARILSKVFRKRSETVREKIEDARKATAEANARLSAIESKLSGLDAEIAAIRSQVEQESLQDEARIKASIGEESARIVAASEQEIEQTAAQERRGLRGFAANLAIEQAAQQLKLTPETDRALIAEFLGDAAKGGQN